jgi:NarL family two-component system response regulator YdfI
MEFSRGVIRVFIVAASSSARAGLQSLLTSTDIEVVGSAPDLELFAGQWLDLEPDILLVEASGEQFETVTDSLAASQLVSEVSIVILSDHFEPKRITEALRAGVRAVLPSDISTEQLVASLKGAAAGLMVMHPAEVNAMFPTASAAQPLAELTEPLTPRENEVLQMLASGLANKEIAARFAISEHTVKFHVASILGKLGARSRTEAVTLGIRRGLVLL